VNIHVILDDKGTANISIGGVTAVDLTFANQFKLETANGELALVSVTGNDRAAINGGEFFALSETYSKKIPEYLQKLDTILNTLVNAVNQQHSKGYSITDHPVT